VVRSVQAAADPAQFAELASEGSLQPWPVKKVYGVMPPGGHSQGGGDVSMDATRFSSVLRGTPSEWSASARRLLFDGHVPPPDSLELKLLLSRVASPVAAPGLFGDIPIAYGSEARRLPPAPLADDLDHSRRLASRRQHLQALLERTEGNTAWAAQVAMLTDGLESRDGGELLFQLAEGYRNAGKLDLAADAYFLLARRFPDHPIADRALVWLVHFYASVEMAHHEAAERPTNVRTGRDGETGKGGEGERADGEVVLPLSPSPPLPVSTAPAIGLSREDRLRRAVQLSEYLQTARPRVHAEPAVRFAEATAQRQLGFSHAAKRYFLTLNQLPESDPWRQCATTEEWLATPGDAPPPKPLATCRRTLSKPYLDGRLDEPLWEAADALHLRGERTDGRQDSGGEVRLAYDDEFLYLSARFTKIAGVDYQPDERPRPRDAELQQHDRFTLQLDIDRDFTTAFELTVDDRGWCRDECWGDANWNPAWYIAAAGDQMSWMVEAAIPLAELTDRPPEAKHVWAVGARRIIPRVGYQSWAGEPSDGDSPGRLGLVIFE
jgi:hypothetical protein